MLNRNFDDDRTDDSDQEQTLDTTKNGLPLRLAIVAQATRIFVWILTGPIAAVGRSMRAPLTRIGLYDFLRLTNIAIASRIRVRSNNIVVEHRIRSGYRLVPADAFTALLREAFSALTAEKSPDQLGDYLEFGVFNGTSLSCAHKIISELGYKHMRFFGFDSFEGMPEKKPGDEKLPWRPTEFKCSIDLTRKYLTEKGIDWDRVHLVKGWFCDTLPNAPIDEIALLRLDGDHYDSTMDALVNLYSKVSPGGYVIIDDYQDWIGCRTAVDEYRQKKGIDNEIKKIDRNAVFWRISSQREISC